MNSTKDTLRADRGELERALKDAGAEFKGRNIRCPFHDDRSPSGSIYQGEDGAWRFRCHTSTCSFCGDMFDVRARASGKPVEELLREHAPDKKPSPPPRVFPTIEAMLESIGHYSTVEDYYVYSHPVTHAPEMIVVRCRDSETEKHFLQARPVNGGFIQRAPDGPLPLFNRSRVASADVVLVVEGEKCVKAMQAVGHVATTSPGGAANARKADWSPLNGKQTVFLWPDNDTAGTKYIRDAAAEIQKLPQPPTLLLIDPAEFGLPEKGDVVDYLAEFAGESPQSKFDAIGCAKSLAQPFGPSSAVRRLLQATIDGTRQAIEWPWSGMNNLTNALLPGAITVICGDPGASKSFLLLQAARKWHRDGVKVALYQLEADEDGSHLLRALAQESKLPDLMNPRWVKLNAAKSLAVESEHRPFIDSFGARLTTPPAQPPTMDELLKWVGKRAAEGCRIIAIDPVTAAETSDKPWQDDRRFVLGAQTILRQHGASLVLVTHPRKGIRGAASGDDMAGGAAYSRFTQTVLWVRPHHPAKAVQCRTACGDFGVEINRSIRIAKSRLGDGGGMDLAFTFGKNLEFKEHGAIVKGSPKVEAQE